MAPRPLHALLWLFAVVACARSNARVELHPPEAPLVAIAVAPVQMPGEAKLEAAERTQVLLDHLWHDSAWPALAPSRWHLRHPDSDDFIHHTDLVVHAQRLGVQAERFAILRSSIAVHEGGGRATVSKGGDVGHGSHYQAEATLGLELVAMDGTVLATVDHRVALDPFAEHPDYDPRSELRRALREAVLALVDACDDCVVPRPEMDLELFANPSVLLNAPGAPLPAALQSAGALEREALLWRAFQNVYPPLSLDEAQRLAELPPGACAAGDTGPLDAGACITAVDGEPIHGPHGLSLALMRDGPHRLEVVSPDGDMHEVEWP